MFVDDIQIYISAGSGGDGFFHFYHDKQRPKGGPDGGDGGQGGDVYALAVNDFTYLSRYHSDKLYQAENGNPGGSNQKSGRRGKDLILSLPVGTIIHYDNGTSVELNQSGQKIILLRGGRGGFGNYHFRSSLNQQPRQTTPGEKKLKRRFRLELKLIADIGIIGLPNAGKTSLLNELTRKQAKVAAYPFTTLEPNLGVSSAGLVVADIPGLIQGASQGRGLGDKFLRHLEKTRVLLHCLSADSANPEKDYQIIRQELKNFRSSLAEKKEILIITKSDLKPPSEITEIQKRINASLSVSILDPDSLKKLNSLLNQAIS